MHRDLDIEVLAGRCRVDEGGRPGDCLCCCLRPSVRNVRSCIVLYIFRDQEYEYIPARTIRAWSGACDVNYEMWRGDKMEGLDNDGEHFLVVFIGRVVSPSF